MALINCPECNAKISDQADSCPKCGYELKNRNTNSNSNTPKGKMDYKYLVLVVIAVVVAFLLFGRNGRRSICRMLYYTIPQRWLARGMTLFSQAK